MFANDDTLGSVPSEPVQQEVEIFTVVEQMPPFPGGSEASNEFLAQNLKYPFSALDKQIQGTVYVTFIVCESGLITNPQVHRGVDTALDKAVIYAVNNMPVWNPRKYRNYPAPAQFYMPITFLSGYANLTEKRIAEAKAFEEKIRDVVVVYGPGNINTVGSEFKSKEEFEKQISNSIVQASNASDANRFFLVLPDLAGLTLISFTGKSGPGLIILFRQMTRMN